MAARYIVSRAISATVNGYGDSRRGCWSWMVAPFICPGPFGRYLHADTTLLRIAGLVVMMSPMHVLLAVGGGVTSRRYARRLPHGFRRQGRPREGSIRHTGPLSIMRTAAAAGHPCVIGTSTASSHPRARGRGGRL